MQLFTMGIEKLNEDGTPVLDGAGEPIPVYDNDDIMTFAKAWTGFENNNHRGNMEMFTGNGDTNMIDPLKVSVQYRDAYPKLDLDENYIGDGAPLCTRLPPRAFLKHGASYQYNGQKSQPKHQDDSEYVDGTNASREPWYRFDLSNTTSALYAALCDADPDTGACRFKSEVTLGEDLECDALECEIDQPRMVRLRVPGLGDRYVYYCACCRAYCRPRHHCAPADTLPLLLLLRPNATTTTTTPPQ